MGGVVETFTAPFEAVGRVVGSIVSHPERLIPAAVGIATGNPLLAAAAAGGSAAIKGGGAREILTSTAMSGLGGAAGNALGNTPMYVSRYLGGSDVVRHALVGAGTYYGSNAYQKMADAQRRSFNAPVSTPLAPSMEDMRANAVLTTRKVFGEHGLYSGYGVSSKYMKKLRKQRPKYGYREWKDLVRSRE